MVDLLPDGAAGANGQRSTDHDARLADVEALWPRLPAESGRSRWLVLLPPAQLRRGWGQLSGDPALRQQPIVWLVVAPPDDATACQLLTGLRLLGDVPIYLPAGSDEAAAMVEGAAALPGSCVVWLPRGVEESVAPAAASAARFLEPLACHERFGEGDQVGVITAGAALGVAQRVAAVLAAEGIGGGVLNLRSLHPLDEAGIVQLAHRVQRLTVLEGPDTRGCLSGAVLEVLSSHGGPAVHFQLLNTAAYPGEPPAAAVTRLARACGGAVPGDLAAAVGSGHNGLVLERFLQWQQQFGLIEQQYILAQRLSPEVQWWVDEYEKLGHRELYLWKWCLHGLHLTTLPTVSHVWRDHLCDTKLLAVMFGVLLDDVADQQRDAAYLRTLLRLVNQERVSGRAFSPWQKKYAKFTVRLWKTILARLSTYPCCEDYRELLEYDHEQIFNVMAYACLVNRQPSLLNLAEHDIYQPHNMQMMSFATMDLMCSPQFDRRELGLLREAIWNAQCMGRIGNLVSTWQREIADRDFSSGVFARALRQGDLRPDDLRRGSPAELESAIRSGRHEEYFVRRWMAHREQILSLRPRFKSFDLKNLVAALERLFRMELVSRGRK